MNVNWWAQSLYWNQWILQIIRNQILNLLHLKVPSLTVSPLCIKFSDNNNAVLSIFKRSLSLRPTNNKFQILKIQFHHYVEKELINHIKSFPMYRSMLLVDLKENLIVLNSSRNHWPINISILPDTNHKSRTSFLK